MKKFKELMAKPITWGDVAWLNFWTMIGYLAVIAGFIGIGKWESRKAKKAKKEKKGYTTVKPVGSDGWYNPEYYNQEEK